MEKIDNADNAEFFGKENVWRILLRIAPPVMAAQLVQALYNIVDSYFIGGYSGSALTAMSVIYPVQQLITATVIGTGVGVNTLMAQQYALKDSEAAQKTAGTGTALGVVMWFVFTVVSLGFLRPFCNISAETESAASEAYGYGLIVCVGSLGIFLESVWTKIHQASGDMKTPMIAQIIGAAINIILDPLFIFSLGLGIRGAAAATVIGQSAAALIVSRRIPIKPPSIGELSDYAKRIMKLGYPSICMQALYTFYIAALNMILAGFCDEAVTVLGLYYKLQAFFFIPFLGLQTCIVPVISYNYGKGRCDRCRSVFKASVAVSAVLMSVGILCFELLPDKLIHIFSQDETVTQIGVTAFRIIALSFIPIVSALMPPTFLMAVGKSKLSAFLSVLRQVICFVPIFKALSLFGLDFCWWAFPITEVVTSAVALIMYFRVVKGWGSLKKSMRFLT